jgi:cell wall-associated NlpC family hydrolase
MKIPQKNAWTPRFSYPWGTYDPIIFIMKIVFRLPYARFDALRFSALVTKMLETEYRKGATDGDAPGTSDCVTSVRYILTHSTDIVLPHGYIGDMHQILLDMGAEEIPVILAQTGDIVLFERMSLTHKKYMIAHMWVMTSPTEFFHSSLYFAWGNISLLADITYNPSILDESFVHIAHDPRNHV